MFSSIWLNLVILVIVYVLYKLVIQPQIGIYYYTKQGIKQRFFAPLIGLFYYLLKDMNGKQKDALYSQRMLYERLKGTNSKAFVSNAGSSPLLYLLDAGLIGEFLQKQTEFYKKTEFGTKMSQILFGQGIVFAEGEEWKAKRKLLSNIFHYKLIEDQVKLVLQVCEKTFSVQDQSKFCFLTTAEKIGGDVGLMSFLGADVNNYTLFGKEPNVGINEFILEFMKYFQNPLTMFMGEFLLKHQVRPSDKYIYKGSKEINSLIKKIIVDSIDQTKEKMKNNDKKEQTTIISLMLQNGLLQGDKEIEDFVTITMNFYFAAKDTVSRLVANMFYFLGKNQHIYENLEKEILSHKDEDITLENMKKYTYLEAVIKESLRYCGPTPFLLQRLALVDHEIGPYKIKKGTEVNCNFIYNYFNEEYFQNPMEFNPERWLDLKQVEKVRINPFAYLPFSGGSRNCIGQYFAMMEIKTIFIYFIRTYQKFQIPEDFVYHIIIRSTIETKDHLTVPLQKREVSS